MANSPKKIQDPTEAALSAIQEALSMRSAETPTEDQPAVPPESVTPQPEFRTRAGSAPIVAPAPPRPETLFENPIPIRDDEPPARRAANDDRQSIGQILQTLQRKPPRTTYLVASLFALAWVAGGLILAGLYLPDLQAVVTQGPAGIPAMIGLAAFVLAPVMFFYVLAHMVWRSQ